VTLHPHAHPWESEARDRAVTGTMRGVPTHRESTPTHGGRPGVYHTYKEEARSSGTRRQCLIGAVAAADMAEQARTT
jgi:hypothetical protein